MALGALANQLSCCSLYARCCILLTHRWQVQNNFMHYRHTAWTSNVVSSLHGAV